MMLAWTPFLDPINALQSVWLLLLIPFTIAISMIWKAVKTPSLRDYPRDVAVMTMQILLAMLALSIALGIMVQFVIPMLPVQRL